MAAHATRSASGGGGSPCLLLALSHDALGVIVDGLADPLQPVVAVAFSSTCKGLRTPLRAALEVLQQRHLRAAALCSKIRKSCAMVCDATELLLGVWGLNADDMATLGMILQTNGLPRLQRLGLGNNRFGDEGMQALCGSLGPGALPSLHSLGLKTTFASMIKLGPAGAEALAAALGRGAMPQLQKLDLNFNHIGSQGAGALALPLCKLPALKSLHFEGAEIGDEGVASLVANLLKDDFKKLEFLALHRNRITDSGMAVLVSAIDKGMMPSVQQVILYENDASGEARDSVRDALYGLARAIAKGYTP